MAEVTYISYSARAKSTTADGIFAEAHQILDVSKNKNQQAINAEVTTELGKKVAKSDFDSFKTSNTSAIAAKADKSYVDTELGKKATKSEVSAVDEKFAGVFCNVDEVINNGGEVRVTIDTVDKKKVDIDLPVYHKSVVDTKLGTKANSADVYTKTQVYTKGETDTKLGAKANSADVYTKSQVYTKGEVDGKVGAAKMQKILITDLDKETLDKLKADASRACMQVVDSRSCVVGVVFQYSDSSNHVLTQEFHTHYVFESNGTFDGTTGKLNAHNHHSVAVLSRMFVGCEGGSVGYDFANSMSVYCNDFGWLSPEGNAIQDYLKLFKYNVSAMPTGQNFPDQKWTPWRNIEAEDAYFINQRMEKLEKLLTLA